MQSVPTATAAVMVKAGNRNRHHGRDVEMNAIFTLFEPAIHQTKNLHLARILRLARVRRIRGVRHAAVFPYCKRLATKQIPRSGQSLAV